MPGTGVFGAERLPEPGTQAARSAIRPFSTRTS
jgi:hypothetical protein